MAETSSKFPIKTESQTAAPMAGPAWPPFDNLRREIDRVFDSFHRGWPFPFPRSSFDFDLPSRRLAGWNVAPAVDVTEREKDYEITAELPGLDEKDIEVKVANGVLTIKGEKKDEKEEKQTIIFPSAVTAPSCAPSSCPRPSTRRRSKPASPRAC